MKLLDKILFLQKAMNLKDHEFLARFKIKSNAFKKWKAGIGQPEKQDVLLICKEFNLDIEDFISDSSSMSYIDMKEGEHPCKLASFEDKRTDVIYEDFAREDNSRYEEKD